MATTLIKEAITTNELLTQLVAHAADNSVIEAKMDTVIAALNTLITNTSTTDEPDPDDGTGGGTEPTDPGDDD